LEAAKQEYEQSSRNEAARLTYVSKLTRIADRLVSAYRSGQRNDELMRAINSELQKHPAPKDIDSKKLRQLLVGSGSHRATLMSFVRMGSGGNEDGPVSGNWHIKGNQLIEAAHAERSSC